MPKVSRRKPCKKSETRDKATKRCRKKVSKSRKPCKKSQIRDLATKRCRMKKSKRRSKPRKKSGKKSPRKYKKRTASSENLFTETDTLDITDNMGDEERFTETRSFTVPEKSVVVNKTETVDLSKLMKVAKQSVMKEVSGQFDSPVDKIMDFFTLLIAALKDPEKWEDMPDINTSMLVECFRLTASKAESKNNDMNTAGVEMILEGFEKEGARIFKMIKENYFDQYLEKDALAKQHFEKLKATLQDDEKRASAMFNYLMINPPKV